MKLTIFLMLIGLLNVKARGLSQSVTYTGKNMPLREVFAAIKGQTGYVFVYVASALKGEKPVTISVENEPLEKVLNKLVQNREINWTIEDKTIIIKKIIRATPKDLLVFFLPVTGAVKSADGLPLAGINISVKGSGNGTITDDKGLFNINAPAGSVLVISSAGYETKEVKITAENKPINITLVKRIAALDETVVTAYSIEKRTKELGYSVAKVSGEEINRANSGSLLTGLIGKVSGVNITTQSTDMSPQMRILIRGIRSFGQNSNNQPLFIFNGSPLSFGADQTAAQLAMDFLNNINPSDIEDVTVLKGANGTAIYGPEGVNGVIIITTKKGAKGKPVINFRTNNSFQIVDFRRENRQRLFGTGSGTDQYGNRSFYSWGPRYDGRMVPIGYPDGTGELQMVPYQDTKEAHKFFNTARANRNNLSFSQSDANSSFYLGLGYIKQTGLLPGDKQDQATVLFNASKNFGNINVQLNVNYARTNDNLTGEVRLTRLSLVLVDLMRLEPLSLNVLIPQTSYSERDGMVNIIPTSMALR